MKSCKSLLFAATAMLIVFLMTQPLLAAGKIAAPVQNTVTISFDDSTPSSTNFLGIDTISNIDYFYNWDDNYAGERALWGSFGGGPNEIYAGIKANAGPNGAGDNAAFLSIPSNNGLGSYYANLLWQVKGLQLGNTYGGTIIDTASGTIPVPTDFDSFGSYKGIHVAANFKTDVPDAAFRVNIDTGLTKNTKTIDDGLGGVYSWVQGNVPGLVEQSRTGSRAYTISTGTFPADTWSATIPSLVSDLADLDAFGWSNPSFDPFQGKGVRSFDLTRVGITFPGGGQTGELLVDEITLSGPDVLKYHAADYNYDQTVDAADIDMLFDAVLGAELNDTLAEPDPGTIGQYAWEPVWGQDKILLARDALTEKFSLTKSDLDTTDVLNHDDIDYLVQVVLGTQYGDLDLDGDKDAADQATLTAHLGMAGGWADGDLNGDGMVDAADQAIFGSVGIAGDYNGNGKVDAADYVVWRKTIGTQPEYDTWRAHFGEGAGTGTAIIGGEAVPEPSTLALVAMTMIAALLAVRNRE